MSEFQWKSVKEQPPKWGQRVLLFYPAATMTDDYVTSIRWEGNHFGATHWCEMPPLPGEERKVYTNCVVASSALSASDFWKGWTALSPYVIDINDMTCQIGDPAPCPDCKGTRQYQPLIGPAEPCRTCCK